MTINQFRNFSILLLFFILQNANGSTSIKVKDSILTRNTIFNKTIYSFINIAPVLSATGNQIFCPGSPMNIVTDFNIVDPDDVGIDAIYIQISSGYVKGQDLLSLSGNYPSLVSSWDTTTGKLTIIGLTTQPTYLELIAAVKNVVYSNNISNPTGVRTFSISVGQANYLPSNGHYYQFIPNIGITWNNAKITAQNSTYYGLQGYLATITSIDEVQISGKQATGAGWIGGSDSETEGVWKWMTGPEIGTIFWNGGINGSSPTFSYWNKGEPNQSGDEDYTHVTAPGVGVLGSWNDLSNTGEQSGDYQPKGYIVEYGGTPGDPVLHISTSTTISIPTINAFSEVNICGSGSLDLSATSDYGIVKWYQNPTGGTPLATGNNFKTPILTTVTTYYLDAFPLDCITGKRTPLTVNIKSVPIISTTNPTAICENNTATFNATTTVGEIFWYSNSTGGNYIATGTTFTTPPLIQTTTYYVEGNNNGCISPARIPVTVVVDPIPVVKDEEVILCENSFVILNAGITNVTYLWSTGETSQSIKVTNPGIYTVTVTSLPPENCSSIKSITVIEHDIPIISNIEVINTKVTIFANGFGDYLYSIDGFNYQNSNIFTVENGGKYTAFVKDVNNCGSDSQSFVVISIPAFFTPNNDGYNDYWSIVGMQYYPSSKVSIFDKFGKLIIELHGSNLSWNGTLNGKNLPSTDYWYNFRIDDTQPETRGHFSLKR